MERESLTQNQSIIKIILYRILNKYKLVATYLYLLCCSTGDDETPDDSLFSLDNNTFMYMKRAIIGDRTNLMKTNIELLLLDECAGSCCNLDQNVTR